MEETPMAVMDEKRHEIRKKLNALFVHIALTCCSNHYLSETTRLPAAGANLAVGSRRWNVQHPWLRIPTLLHIPNHPRVRS